MLLFSQLPTARPQQQPVAPPALTAWSRSGMSSASTSCSRPPRLGLPPADWPPVAARRASISRCRTTSISSSRPPVATHRCSGSRAERATRGAQETNAGAKIVDLRCGAGRSYGTMAPPPSLGSREQVSRGSSDGAAFPHPVWQGSAWSRSRSPFWSPARQCLISGLN